MALQMKGKAFCLSANKEELNFLYNFEWPFCRPNQQKFANVSLVNFDCKDSKYVLAIVN